MFIESELPGFGIWKLALGINIPLKGGIQQPMTSETHLGVIGGQNTLLDFTCAILSEQLNSIFFPLKSVHGLKTNAQTGRDYRAIFVEERSKERFASMSTKIWYQSSLYGSRFYRKRITKIPALVLNQSGGNFTLTKFYMFE